MTQIDHIDARILAMRIIAWNKHRKPRVGDFCLMVNGDYRRFAYNHRNALQTTTDNGQFYFGNGYVEYSGAMDPSIPIERLIRTEEKREGRFWFFHHDSFRAYNEVHVKVRCRVWKVT